MGFFKVCIDIVLSLTQFNPLSPIFGTGVDNQRPLQLPPVHTGPATPVDSSVGGYPSVTKSIVCRYPELEAQGWELCNSETSRSCWLRNPKDPQPEFSQYDIFTNYEEVMPKGVNREYWLYVYENETIQPDGVPKSLGTYFNGSFPGPAIEACWGDTLTVHVTNLHPRNGTTVHWHGIRQLFSNEMDGVNGVTQCPIAPNDTFTYHFDLMQYGHTWYHSHYSLQYPDGVAAPLVIHGPTSSDWDIDVGPVFISDWVHDSAFNQYVYEEIAGPAPVDSILVNGLGHDNVTGTVTGSYSNFTFTPGKKHLLKLINGAVGTSFVFSIDNHTMTVVENDLVPVKPFEVDYLVIGIGQRYTVIVDADQATANYWMRTLPAAGCASFARIVDGRPGPNFSPNETTAIVKYDSSDDSLPTSLPVDRDSTCQDLPPSKLHPVVEWEVDVHPRNNVTDDTFSVVHQNASDPKLGPPIYAHWQIAPQPMWLDFSKPTILNVESAIANPNFTVIKENYQFGYVYLVVESGFPPVTHPIHLHGSDFAIVAQNSTPYDPAISPSTFVYDNPPRRDVAILPAGGYLVLAFKPDNPGAWLMHCHIAWHASAGLALQIIVREKEIPGAIGSLKAIKSLCDKWSAYDTKDPVEQDDSGI